MTKEAKLNYDLCHMTADLQEVTGFRGEKIVELRLTDFSAFPKELFRPAYLGDKWPSIDFYVELRSLRRRTPFFFVQTKATRGILTRTSASLTISTKRRDIERLLRIPGPTYIFGVHEPSQRVFVRSVHIGTPVKAITRIPISNELTSGNLKLLYDEVQSFWKVSPHKPFTSVFA